MKPIINASKFSLLKLHVRMYALLVKFFPIKIIVLASYVVMQYERN